MIATQLLARSERVLGRIGFDPASEGENNKLIQSQLRLRPREGLSAQWPGNVTIWLDPPRNAQGGRPKDCLFWTRLMKHRADGLLRQAIFVKRGAMVTLDIEKPSQFLTCFLKPEAVYRYNIPSFRAEIQLIYVPGLVDNSTGFIKAFEDFGDILKPHRSAA